MNLFILGDSTASVKEDNKRPETGWGEKIHHFLSPHVNVINLAANGKSTRTFIEEKRFDHLLSQLKSGDYVMIQFGHNDEKIGERYTDPFSTYQKNLTYMVKEVLDKHAFPIIFSSITRRKFIHKKIDKYSIGMYPYSSKLLANRLKVAFVDMFNRTRKTLNYIGEKSSRKMFLIYGENEQMNYKDGIFDNTHLNPLGAYIIASLVAEGLTKLKDLELTKYIEAKKILRPIEIKRLLK